MAHFEMARKTTPVDFTSSKLDMTNIHALAFKI